MPLTNTSTGELVTAAWLNAIVDRVNSFLVTATGGIWTGTVQKVAQSFRGLHVRTHPNLNATASQIALLALDEAVMNDGTRYLPAASLFPLIGDIASNGAGGLDTGSEVASTWYEIYLIGKSSTNSTSDLRVLLHRAKNYSLNQSQTAISTNSPLRFGATTHIKLAQSFQTSAAGEVPFVDISVFKSGTPTGSFWMTLEASSGGNPSGTPLATSEKLDVTGFTTSSQWIRFAFRKPTTITASTQYFLVLQGDYAIDGVNYVVWNYQGTNVYANGAFFTYNGSTWSTTTTADQTFKLYVTLNNTALAMPSGYDQSVKLGYVYNNSSSNFVAFDALNNSARRLTASSGANDWVNSTTTIPTLFDLSALIPPCPVIIRNVGSRTAAGFAVVAGSVTDGYGSGGGTMGDWGEIFINAPGANYLFAFPEFHTEYQGAYAYTFSGTAHIYIMSWVWLS